MKRTRKVSLMSVALFLAPGLVLAQIQDVEAAQVALPAQAGTTAPAAPLNIDIETCDKCGGDVRIIASIASGHLLLAKTLH